MDEAIQSTDVGTDSPGAVSESTDTLAPSVEQSGEQTQERSGDDTAQSASLEASVVKEGETTPPPSDEDPLKGIPSADELERLVEQRVPHAQAVLQLRKALEARNGEVAELRGKTSTAEPVLPLIEQYGGPEPVQARLQTFDKLYSPVIDPATQQPLRDARGLTQTTALPFIEDVDAQDPGMAEQILYDALSYQVDYYGNGQKVALYRHPTVQAELLKACGLDPARAEDYRNIDALSAPQDTGVTPEDLAGVPTEFHDVFKSLPPGIRADLKLQDAETRQFNLEVYKERADRKTAEAQAQAAQTQERQAAEQNARQYVAKEQDAFVGQQLQESHAAIMDDLARQVTFSDDAKDNAVMHGVVGACVLALRDPDSSFATGKMLEALGVKVDPGFYQALTDADKHLRDAKAYELFGQQGLKQKALTDANNAKRQALAKAAPIALRIAKALGGKVAARAAQQNGALAGATTTRPVPTDGGGDGSGDGLLPAGMLANDPRAGVYLAKQTGLVR